VSVKRNIAAANNLTPKVCWGQSKSLNKMFTEMTGARMSNRRAAHVRQKDRASNAFLILRRQANMACRTESTGGPRRIPFCLVAPMGLLGRVWSKSLGLQRSQQ
jgi:hypothetical protein